MSKISKICFSQNSFHNAIQTLKQCPFIRLTTVYLNFLKNKAQSFLEKKRDFSHFCPFPPKSTHNIFSEKRKRIVLEWLGPHAKNKKNLTDSFRESRLFFQVRNTM